MPSLGQPDRRAWAPPGDAAPTADELNASLAKGVQILLSLQEGEKKDQWPYEGVYRVRGEIPAGYRVGGTAIVIRALVDAPGFAEDQPRRDAVARGVAYLCAAKDDPDMRVSTYEGGYDVRAWGYIEAILCFSRMKALGAIPPDQSEAVDGATRHYIDALQKLEMPRTGGWNYARPPGAEAVGSPSSFMTAPALEALFEARSQGFAVDQAVVDRAASFLEKTRTPSGTVLYSGEADHARHAPASAATPGAVGRMCAVESALLLAGRSTPDRARSAIDAFIVHWGWLEQRRAKPGTHTGPYNIAPYYFMYAHEAAARAVELLPVAERAEYRRRLTQLLFSVRDADGSWNDRVFRRSAAYATASAMLAIMQPTIPAARWKTPEAE